MTISALGEGLTFTVIISDIAEPRANVSKDHVRTSLAVAWLLFVLAILLASYVAAFEAMREGTVIDSLFVWRILSGALLLGAFLASAEAIRAYDSTVAITAFVVIGTIALVDLYASLRAKYLYRQARSHH